MCFCHAFLSLLFCKDVVEFVRKTNCMSLCTEGNMYKEYIVQNSWID